MKILKQIVAFPFIALLVIFSLTAIIFAPITAIGQESESQIYVNQIDFPSIGITNTPSVFSVNPQFSLADVSDLSYVWNFGDGNSDQGEEVVHTYIKPGNYTVTIKTTFTEESTGNRIELTEERNIYIAQKYALFVTDKRDKQDTVRNFIDLAKKDNIALQEVESYQSQSSFLAEEILFKKLNEVRNSISKSNPIIVWTEAGTGLNALTRLAQAPDETKINFQNTSIILINDHTEQVQRIIRQYQQLKPKEIIVINEAGFIPFLSSANLEEYKATLLTGDYKHAVINVESSKIRPWLILSFFVNYLSDQGVPDNVVLLILLIPLLSFVIAFLKQVVGIASLGLYTTILVTLVFLILGPAYGIIMLLFITLISSLSYQILKKFRLLFIPKMAILMTIISLAIFAILTFAVYYKILDVNFILLAVFPTVVISTLIEKLVTTESSKFYKPFIPVSETILVSIIAYIFAGGPVRIFDWQFQIEIFRNLIFNYPELILLILIGNIILGRWTGLKVSEYLRFRSLLRNTEE